MLGGPFRIFSGQAGTNWSFPEQNWVFLPFSKWTNKATEFEGTEAQGRGGLWLQKGTTDSE